MQTREQLRRRPDVPDEDIDDIIAIASELQEADRRADESATVEEIEAVAAELDIDPSYVEKAIATLEGRRAEQAASAEQSREQASRSRARWARAGRWLAMGLGILMLLTSGVALRGRSQLAAASANVRGAEASLQVAVERQAALVPRLVALQGGDASRLASLAGAVREAEGAIAQVDASAALDQALAEELGKLSSSSSADDLIELRYEIVGSQNRISTEQRRYAEALAEWEGVAQQWGPSLALRVGLAEDQGG